MKSEFRLIGLSAPKSATLHFLDTDKTTFWASVEMSDDRYKALFAYCKDNWDVKKIAEVEHDGFYEDGTPKHPKVLAVRDWDL